MIHYHSMRTIGLRYLFNLFNKHVFNSRLFPITPIYVNLGPRCGGNFSGSVFRKTRRPDLAPLKIRLKNKKLINKLIKKGGSKKQIKFARNRLTRETNRHFPTSDLPLIRINTRLKRNHELLVDTLIHEMVHYDTWRLGLDRKRGGENVHSREFRKRLRRVIKKFNKVFPDWPLTYNIFL